MAAHIVHATIKIVAKATLNQNSHHGVVDGCDPWFKTFMPIHKLQEIAHAISQDYPRVDAIQTHGHGSSLLTLTHDPSPSVCFPSDGHYQDFLLRVRAMVTSGMEEFRLHAVEVRRATEC